MTFPAHARGLLYGIGAATGLAYMGAVWEACRDILETCDPRLKTVIALGGVTGILSVLAMLAAVAGALAGTPALPEVALGLLALGVNTAGLAYCASLKTVGGVLVQYIVVPLVGEIAILTGLWFGLFEGVLGLGEKDEGKSSTAEASKLSA